MFGDMVSEPEATSSALFVETVELLPLTTMKTDEVRELLYKEEGSTATYHASTLLEQPDAVIGEPHTTSSASSGEVVELSPLTTVKTDEVRELLHHKEFGSIGTYHANTSLEQPDALDALAGVFAFGEGPRMQQQEVNPSDSNDGVAIVLLDALLTCLQRKDKPFLQHTIPRNQIRKRPKFDCTQMRTWAIANRDLCYPSAAMKQWFAKDADLTVTQVNNWFVNYRKRNLTL